MAPKSKTLPPVITASSWGTVWQAAFKSALDNRGRRLFEGTLTPRLTNREAVALVVAWHKQDPSESALWYQFAAVAYGWDPATDKLNAGWGQAGDFYPDADAKELWLYTQTLSIKLDAEGKPSPRLDIDPDAFTSAVVLGQVKQELVNDGATARFIIPVPACRDPKTGRYGFPKRNPKTGKWECDATVIIDPLKGVRKSVGSVIVVMAFLYVIFEGNKKRRGRRR